MQNEGELIAKRDPVCQTLNFRLFQGRALQLNYGAPGGQVPSISNPFFTQS